MCRTVHNRGQAESENKAPSRRDSARSWRQVRSIIPVVNN